MKRINITDRMAESMRRAFDNPDLQADNFVVFETVAVTTRPLNKAGTIFNNATIDASVLQEMANQVNAQGGQVPLILQHNVGGESVTPSGQAFEGAVYPTDDGLFQELRTLFAMPNPATDPNKERAALTQDIDNGMISEVSIGAGFKQLLSSANPSFDWFSDEADIMNFYDREDDEGNSIDAGETHGIAKGLRSWTELSLVIRGASSGAKISSSSTQKLADKYSSDSGMFRKLAANADFDFADLVTFSSTDKPQPKKTTPKGDFDMDVKLVLAELTAKGAEVGTLTAKLDASTAKVTELTASNATLTTTVETLTASETTLKEEVATLTAAAATAPADSIAETAVVTAFIDENLAAALTASGKTDVKTEGLTASEKVALIKEAGVKLHQLHASESGASGVSEDDAAQAKRLAFLKANRGT